MLMRLPTPNGPPVQPVLTSQQAAPCSSIFFRSRSAYTYGWWTMNGPPKQALKVISGSMPRPISVPAILLV
jgi:hypothetical protein